MSHRRIGELRELARKDETAHMEALEAESILTHLTFGKRIRYYKFNEASPKAKAVRGLIETFKQELSKS